MAIIRLDNVDDNVSDLVGDAAKRKGMLKHAFINQLLEKVANQECAKQQCDDARTDKND